MGELDELLELLKDSQEESNSTGFKENKNVLRFIRHKNLLPGDNKVPTYLIYYTYIKWCQEQWQNRISKIGFFRTFNRHFEQKRSGNQRFYMINDSIDLSKEFYEKAKTYDRKRQKTGKKKKQKI